MIARRALLAALLPGQALAQPGGWASWSTRRDAVFEGNFTASDPSIVRDGAELVMAYTDLDPFANHTTINLARSADGVGWRMISEVENRRGRVLEGVAGSWDENLEGPELVRVGTGWHLYYSGYRDQGTPQRGFPASLGLARSTDGSRFTRVGAAPILSPEPGWYDNDAIFSPTVRVVGGQFVMLYAAHAYSRFNRIAEPGVVIAAATSPDGIAWTRRPEPALRRNPAIAFMRSGVAEPCLVQGPDQAWYLFFTGLNDAARSIGVARGATPWGPWTINPQPIVAPSPPHFTKGLALAPQVLIEAGRARLWFIGHDDKERIRIGLAEAPWPLLRAP